MDEEKISYKTLIDGDIPPWVMRFIKGVGKAINKYGMIKSGDTVLIAASGGKDSLALALALSLRRKWLPVSYNLEAVMIDWIEHPIDPEYREKLKTYFKDLDIDLTIVDEKQYPESFKGEFNCYLCSRNRRRILFQWADEHNEKLIAMGHHLDDLVETTMMNLCFRGKFSTMLPVQEFFDGKMHIIRPMIETKEPSSMSIETSESACTAFSPVPYIFVRFFVDKILMAFLPFPFEITKRIYLL